MIVELISVGTEILMGNIVNTNAAYLSRKCAELGLPVYYEVTVGDNGDRVYEAVKTALSRSDVVMLTGGLGPTKDDLTKEMAAKAAGLDLIMDDHTKKRIETYFEKIHVNQITENNWKQAEVMEGAIVVDNQNGTAPGQIAELKDGKRIILMPGPPNELYPMFERDIIPYLQKLQPFHLYSKMVKICGIGESRAETELADLIENQTNPTIAPYAKTSEVHFRITASGKTDQEAEALVMPMVEELRKRFGDNIYTIQEEETLEEAVVTLLKQKNLTVAFAESCTGGLLAGKVVNVPGASEVLGVGFITYSNEAKMKYLKVNDITLAQYGAVSKQTAEEMAMGAAREAGTDTAVAVTGIAGPDGGTKEKPVGLVFVGCYVKGTVTVKELRLQGNRQKVRDATVIQALDLLRRCIIQNIQ